MRMFPFGFGCGCGQDSRSSSESGEIREVVHEVIMIPCKYCGALFPQTATFCPHCGARRTA